MIIFKRSRGSIIFIQKIQKSMCVVNAGGYLSFLSIKFIKALNRGNIFAVHAGVVKS